MEIASRKCRLCGESGSSREVGLSRKRWRAKGRLESISAGWPIIDLTAAFGRIADPGPALISPSNPARMCQQRPWHHINKQLVDDQQSCFRPIYNNLALIIFGSKRLFTEVETSLG